MNNCGHNLKRCPAARGQEQKGFTLIELMVVIAIVSILATIALAAYSNFMIRSKVSEGLTFATEAKTAVISYYAGNSIFPLDNDAAGLPLPDAYAKYNHIQRLEVENNGSGVGTGIITITVGISGLGANNKLQLVPSAVNGSLTWECRPALVNGIDRTRVPPNCRG